ncbi:MAG: hypothetical protein IKM66_08885 [Clostridia bacterium]|nr:hypothetical protein [Clostridia bacterium]
MKMKKILAVILSALMLLSIGCVAAYAEDTALPLSAGLEALQGQFEYGEGPETNGYTIDYRYYSPAKENDDTKYPLVIWLHGMSEGLPEGKQIKQNNIAYWTSAEFQARFEGTEGAYIMAPRSLEEKLIFWDDTMIFPLRAAIDDFIAENAENIDISRIYIGGFSMGGKMTLKMAVAYPDMFAAAFPICPAWTPSAEQTALFADIPVWLTSGKGDPLVNYSGSVTPTWKNIASTNNAPELCRFSTLSSVRYPDGSKTSSAHHAWFAVNYDMFSIENGDYPDMSTVNGNGEVVTLTYPNGMISWLSQFTSDYDGTPATDSGNIPVDENTSNLFSFDTIKKIFEPIINFFKKILEMLIKLF